MREREIGAVEKHPWRAPLYPVCAHLALVGVGVNRIGKVEPENHRITQQSSLLHEVLSLIPSDQNGKTPFQDYTRKVRAALWSR